MSVSGCPSTGFSGSQIGHEAAACHGPRGGGDDGREMARPGICAELAELLSTVQRPGDFFASGRLELLAPA
jgi:hypothetical protein